jgi:hypothetical protein
MAWSANGDGAPNLVALPGAAKTPCVVAARTVASEATATEAGTAGPTAMACGADQPTAACAAVGPVSAPAATATTATTERVEDMHRT